MKIMLVNEYKTMSGAEVVVANIIKFLSECGHESLLVTAEDLGHNTFASYLDSFKPDIVHFHNITGIGLEPIKVCKERKIPCVFTIHDYYIVCQNRMYYRWDQKRECGADNWNECHNCRNNVIGLPHPSEIFNILMDVPIVCISKYQESIIRRFGYKNTTVIYNGIVI